jgi:protein SCO1/2
VIRITAAILAAALVAGCAAPPSTPTLPAAFPPRAILVERPIVPPDVPMIDHTGRPARLSDFRGRHVLIFFGNVDCSQDCVDGLRYFEDVKRSLGARDDVAYVMVGTDNKVNTPEVLRRYLEQADPGFVGLTAERGPMRELAVRFGIHTYERPDGALAPHAPFLYLLDPQGRLIYFFQDGLAPMRIAEVMRAELGPESH